MSIGRFYPANNEFDTKYSQLRNSFRARMNGAIEGQMKSRGIKYRINFGISIPHIKEISSKFSFTPQECERLWFNEIREAMIVAAMQMPDDKLDTETMKNWSSCIKNIDIAEQAAFFMISRMVEPHEFFQYLINSNDPFLTASAFFAAGRYIQNGQNLSHNTLSLLNEYIDGNWPSEMNIAMRGISFYLRQVMRKKLITTDKAQSLIDRFSEKDDVIYRKLAEDLKTEMIFLEEE